MPTLPTFDKTVPDTVQTAFRRLKESHDELKTALDSLKSQVGAIPPAPTFAQINKALSSGGSNPLNLTNLVGTPATTASLATQVANIPAPANPSPPPPGVPPGTDNPVVPTPTPTPPPPPGHAGGDMIPLSSIVVVNSPPLGPMASTAVITQMGVDGSGFSPVFSTQNTWPDVTPPGWKGPMQFTLWMVLKIGGQWYASGVIQFWRGLATGGGPLTQVGVNWFYGTAWGPMSGHQPAPGELVGFLVTAGNQRQGANNFIVAERSNIIEVAYPSPGAVFNFT